MKKDFESAEGIYRRYTPVNKLKESLASIIEDARVRYRNRELILFALFSTQVAVFGRQVANPHLSAAIFVIYLVGGGLHGRSILQCLKKLEGLNALYVRLGPSKALRSPDSLDFEQWALPGWRQNMDPFEVFFTMLTSAVGGTILTLYVGLDRLRVDVMSMQVGVGLVATLMACFTSRSLVKVKKDFRGKMEGILSHIEPQAALSSIDIANNNENDVSTRLRVVLVEAASDPALAPSRTLSQGAQRRRGGD